MRDGVSDKLASSFLGKERPAAHFYELAINRGRKRKQIMQWFRMYAEFAYDAKVQSLSETLQRRYVMLLCYQCNGELAKLSDDDLAFALRIGESELEATFAELRRKRLIGENREILGWSKRQYQSDGSSDRVRRHRERKRFMAVTETALKQDVTAPDSDKDTERDNSKNRRGSRFTLTELPVEWEEICKAMRPDLDPTELFAEFRDYWIGVPGQRGCKLDWFATWRNRIRDKKPVPQKSLFKRPQELKKSNVRTL